VTKAVVDILEAIQVEHQERQVRVFPPCAAQGVLQAQMQHQTIGETGDMIVASLVFQTRLRFLDTRDVGVQGDVMKHLACSVLDHADRQ
jgi:hypothetical protein